MIVYRLTPATEPDQEPPLPPYPSKRQLVEHAAWQARNAGVPYGGYLWVLQQADPRYRNIEAPRFTQ